MTRKSRPVPGAGAGRPDRGAGQRRPSGGGRRGDRHARTARPARLPRPCGLGRRHAGPAPGDRPTPGRTAGAGGGRFMSGVEHKSGPKPVSASATAPVSAAERLLAERIGLDSQSIGPGMIDRALDARMDALGLTDRDAYLRRLAGSAVEQQELVEEVVIPESWFFRDDRPFVALRSYVTQPARGRRPCRRPVLEHPVRLRRGAVLDRHHPARPGTQPHKVRRSMPWTSVPDTWPWRRGIYRENAFRGNDLSFRDRYFRPDRRRPEPALDRARYAPCPVPARQPARPGPAPRGPPYDIIFCRNVLIYFDAPARRRAGSDLDRLLVPDRRPVRRPRRAAGDRQHAIRATGRERELRAGTQNIRDADDPGSDCGYVCGSITVDPAAEAQTG